MRYHDFRQQIKIKAHFEDEFCVLAIEHVVGANTSNVPVHGDEGHVANINSSNVSKDKPTYDPVALLDHICAQKNNLFCEIVEA